MLLVHGIYAGSSSYEFRKLFPLLARDFRVVAIDLLGCGLSDRPNLHYTAQLFTEQIADAISRFGPSARGLVGSSMGAAFSILAAARVQAAVRRLVAICPTGLAGTLDGKPRAAQRAVKKLILARGIGQGAFDLLASRPSLRWFLQNQAYADPSSATPEIVEDYWITTHQPGSRYVPAHFVGGALNCSVADALPELQMPLLVAWGERTKNTAPISTAPAYVERTRSAQLVTFANSGLLPHEEEPELVAQRLGAFFAAPA